MARRRKGETAEMRDAIQKIAGMKSIEARLDLGNNVGVENSEGDLATVRTALENYNQSLAVSDGLLNVFNAANKNLGKSNKKILPAVGLKYGTDSDEYEKAGGVRESERKKRTTKPKPTS